MQFSTILFSTLAVAASAAPTSRASFRETTDASDALEKVSDYFNLLANKVQFARIMDQAPACDVSRAQMPIAPEALPAPAAGHRVHHVAVGRGTQNYTCDTSNSTAVPAAQGAVAVLFNASCIAALYPDLLQAIPGMAVHFTVDEAQQLGPAGLQVSGHHYFIDSTTPAFDLSGPDHDYGMYVGKRANGTNAPTTAAVGLGGEKAVPWLLLDSVEGTTQNLQEVYRVNTAGGSAPATCAGQPESFQIEYATVYWFFEGADEE